MNAENVAGLAALTVIAVPLLIAMGASMRPERRRAPAGAPSVERALLGDTAAE